MGLEKKTGLNINNPMKSNFEKSFGGINNVLKPNTLKTNMNMTNDLLRNDREIRRNNIMNNKNNISSGLINKNN